MTDKSCCHTHDILDVAAAVVTPGVDVAALKQQNQELLEALERLTLTGSAATGRMMCEFDELHEYIERILERPVFTHEMGIDSIAKEIREKAQPDFVAAIKQARAAIKKAGGSDAS